MNGSAGNGPQGRCAVMGFAHASAMNVDLPTLRTFFASAPFIVDLGVVPVEVSEGCVMTALDLVPQHRDGQRVLVAKASATMALTARHKSIGSH